MSLSAENSSSINGEARERWLIAGAGSFGTAFARILSYSDVDVTLAARTDEHVAQMRRTRTNERYFPGIEFAGDISFTTIDQAAEQEWDGIVLAVPTSSFRVVLAKLAHVAPVFLSLAKGLDPSGRRLSEAAAEVIDLDQLVVLSGPNIAYEIMLDQPTAAVVAGTDTENMLHVQRVVNGITFRVYASDDLIGVELAGACKNVIAIAAGVAEGAGVGDNGVSALMTRGLGEMARLGLAMGAQLQTYLGLAGVGDLITTCASPHSRNKRAGKLLAEGLNADEVRARIGQAVEGLRTAPIVLEMARLHTVEMHLCEAVVAFAYDAPPLAEFVRAAMSRPPTWEFSSHHVFDPPSTVE